MILILRLENQVNLGSQGGRRIPSESFLRRSVVYKILKKLFNIVRRPHGAIKIALHSENSASESSNVYSLQFLFALAKLTQSQIRDLEARVEILSGTKDEALSEMRNVLKGRSFANHYFVES